MIKHHEFPLFFEAVTKLFVMDADFFRIYRLRGFTASDWPECNARNLALRFESVANQKSIEAAKVLMRDQLMGLGDYPLELSIDELWAVYSEMRAFGVWSQAAEKILRDPLRGPEVVSTLRQASNVKTILVQEVIDSHIERRVKSVEAGDPQKIKIPGWPKLSESIGGFNPGRVFLFVAGTGIGKTTLALNLVQSAGKAKDFPTLVINMEMTIEDILDRVVSIGSGTNSNWLEHLQKEDLNRVLRFVSEVRENSEIYLTDGKALSIEEIASQISHSSESVGTKLVVVDYDQKIRTSYRGEEWQTIQRAIEQLEEIAKSTKTAIIVLAQGDESGDPKASKRSMQPCSAVISMYREGERYFLESKKNRFGKKFRISLECDFSKYQIKEGDYVAEEIPIAGQSLSERIHGAKNLRRSSGPILG